MLDISKRTYKNWDFFMRDKSSHEHKLVPESDNPGDKIGIPNIA